MLGGNHHGLETKRSTKRTLCVIQITHTEGDGKEENQETLENSFDHTL